MSSRNYSTTDLFFLIADDALKTLSGNHHASKRANPATKIKQEALSPTDKVESARLMRVNHSGEICAQALYRSQALTARSEKIKQTMIHAVREENDHLHWCEERIQALGGRTSVLNPIWYAGSFALGATAGLLGDRWSLSFLAETELQVENHLSQHLDRISENDIKSRAILNQMKKDEANHASTANHAGATELPFPIKTLMKITSQIMTKTSHWL